MSRIQEPPYSVQVELTEGCNLRCHFCGLQGIREEGQRNYKFMEHGTAYVLFEQMLELGWNSRIEFAMHGEPTMHPDAAGIISIARSVGLKNQLMMTSNGGGLLGGRGPVTKIKELFDVGLHILALDDYAHASIIGKIRQFTEQLRDIAEVYEYPEQPNGNPHRRVRKPMISFMQDPTSASVGTHSKIVNHTGAAYPLDYSAQGKRCHRPFREISIRYDGNVALCCNDWRGTFKCGNIVDDGLSKVWQGQAMNAAREKLYAGERTFAPCLGCNAVSHRVGLLPDPLGKATLSPPNPDTERIIEEAIAGAPYTAPVLRPWEQR